MRTAARLTVTLAAAAALVIAVMVLHVLAGAMHDAAAALAGIGA